MDATTQTKTIKLNTDQLRLLAELVHQERRQAQDMGEVETAALCDSIMDALVD